MLGPDGPAAGGRRPPRAAPVALTGYGDKAHLFGPEVGLDTHVEDVVRLIKDEDLTDVILVGHSYAGLVISSAANEVPERIAHLVYLDAMVPEHGETAGDAQPVTQHLIDAAATVAPWRIPPLPEPPPPFGLFGVTDPADQEWLRGMLSDHPVLCLQQPACLDNPSLRQVPRTHVHCVGAAPEGIVRRPVPALQPNGTPSRVCELPTGHDCMITMPVELSELLLDGPVRPGPPGRAPSPPSAAARARPRRSAPRSIGRTAFRRARG